MLYNYIEESAYSAIVMQEDNGSMPPGHNGPYYDPETPVRNTSHWLITFLKAYKVTGDKKYLDAALKASNYLCSKEARPMGAAFWHRKNPQKDFCNGLIGQAWTIEALVEAAVVLEKPELSHLAEEVFLMHPFDWNAGVWQRVAVDGMHLTIDGTFNHQLWFAAAGGLLAPYSKETELRVQRFLNRLHKLIHLYSNGLIRHSLFVNQNLEQKAKKMFSFTKGFLINRKPLIHKAIGYHQFNLYALAMLKQFDPEHSFWQSNKFEKLWNYANSDQYKQAIKNNQFGYPYNPPGFEMAFALAVFKDESDQEQQEWLAEQFQRCFDFKTNLMTLDTKDPMTQAARLYEVTRMPDLDIEIII